MATATPIFGTVTTHTITLASLASDTNLVAGRAGTVIDNVSEEAVDAAVGGIVTTGASSTAARQIEIWLYGSYDGTTYTGGATGSDANLTPSEKTLMKLLTVIPHGVTTSKAYQWGPFSVAQAFGGTMPRKWGAYVVHNTGVALSASGHEVKHTPIKYDST